MTLKLTPFDEVLKRFAKGEMIIMVDDVDRENEGDFVVATEAAEIGQINTMMRQGRGLICVTITKNVSDKLNLPLQAVLNNSLFHTAFTVSVDLLDAKGQGATLSERLKCMKALVKEDASENDFVVPGNVFPLIAHTSGTLGRMGQTEGSTDLARLSGLKPSAIICEILEPDGSMSRSDSLAKIAKEGNYAVTSVAEVRNYRLASEVHVRLTKEFDFDTPIGKSRAYTFADDAEGKEHLALAFGNLTESSKAPLVRVHSECLTGDVFGSRRCDCGSQLSKSLELIKKEGRGILIYLRQEGRGIGIANKVKAYQLQDLGMDTVEANEALGFQADQRQYRVAARMLEFFKINSIRLITNNPRKVKGLEDLGVKIEQREQVIVAEDSFNSRYLSAKREKLGHLL